MDGTLETIVGIDLGLLDFFRDLEELVLLVFETILACDSLLFVCCDYEKGCAR